jgi:plastocyanin
MMRLLRLAVAALFATLAVAACSAGNGSSKSGDTPAATTSGGGGGGTAAATITIQNFRFGDPITVKPGETVKVTNQDGAAHNVISDDGSSFKTPDLQQGESATFTAPAKAGTYKFSCTLHSSMSGIGTLTVQG